MLFMITGLYGILVTKGLLYMLYIYDARYKALSVML